jgi:hypothetical protein
MHHPEGIRRPQDAGSLSQNAHCPRLLACGAFRALTYIEAGARNPTRLLANAIGNESNEPNQALMTGRLTYERASPRKPSPPVRSAPRCSNAELTGDAPAARKAGGG